MLISKVGEVLVNFNFEASLQEVLKILYSYWDINHSFISLFDPQTQSLKIASAFGLTDNQIKGAIFKKGEGMVGKVFKYETPIFLQDLEERGYLNKLGLKEVVDKGTSFLAVPLKISNQVLGVLGIFKKFKEGESKEKAIEILQTLATLISIAYLMNKKHLLEKSSWEEEKRFLTQTLYKNFNQEGIIGRSQAIQNLINLIKKVGQTEANILLTGESGTGKSYIARAIHFLSPRKNKPLVTVNCAAIPETLLEAELFGYEKGAFTGAFTSKKGKFELADTGTLFLDEIGDLPLNLQPKLLRVLQEKVIEKLGKEEPIKVDVRIIAATNRPLEKLIKEGRFREDLYYRLSVISLHLPPLRERTEDIPLLTEHFLHKFNRLYEKEVRLDPGVINLFMKYTWPGNVRELENLIERLVILSDGSIRPSDLPEYFLKLKPETKEGPLSPSLENKEKEEIIKALEKTGYIKSRAAKLLGLTLRQLDYRIKKYGISIIQF